MLKEIFQFTFNVDSIEGTYLEKRIESAILKEKKFYKPREGQINKNMHLVNESQKLFIEKYLSQLINYFGFSDVPMKNNSLGFYQIVDILCPEDLEKYREFERLNKRILKRLMKEDEVD